MRRNILRIVFLALACVVLGGCVTKDAYQLSDVSQFYQAPPTGVETRWVSAENMSGAKGKGAMSNRGAKGDAYLLIAPGQKKVIFDQTGPGMITKIWSANGLLWEPSNRRKVSIQMYWDGAEKPAVSVPLFDFFGNGLSVINKFESALFASPEGKSHNCFIPMPYQESARIVINNQSDRVLMFYFKINFLKLDRPIDDAMYFHAYWHRDTSTDLGKDFKILPRVHGTGRYLGCHVGVIGNPWYKGSWYGEGEVKVYLDGDDEYPTLAGTGTEDYIGSGWGQGEYANMIQGSLISDKEHDLYSFYRYHTLDPVYFHQDCEVTIQQMGNAQKRLQLEMRERGADITPVWSYVAKDGMNASKRYLDMANPPALESDEFPAGVSTNFYRSDDVCATAYFYLNTPASNLPELQALDVRTQDMESKVFKFKK